MTVCYKKLKTYMRRELHTHTFLEKYMNIKICLCRGLPVFAVFMTWGYKEIDVTKDTHSFSYLMAPAFLLHISVRTAQDECG